jgi:hypothetical protein
MSLVLNVEILGQFANLTKATTGAQTELQTMNARAANVSKAMTRAFLAIGVGFSLRSIVHELETATKAAVDDNKSQELLANAMRNTVKANDEQIASVETSITKLSLQGAIMDDQLRPAYATLLRATKDTTEATSMLHLAMDVAAGTGRGLDQVTLALAKSLSGSDTALNRLVPSLKGAKDPVAELTKMFDGAAAAAANTDPYARMKVVTDQLQESIGNALLPALQNFANFMASPEGQQKLKEFTKLLTDMVGGLGDVISFVIENHDAVIGFATAFGVVTLAVKGLNVALGIYNGIATITAARNAAVAASETAVGTAASGAAVKVGLLNTALGLIARVAGTVALVLSLGGDSASGGGQANTTTKPKINVPNAPVVNSTPVPTGGLNVGNIQFGRQSVPTEVNINLNNSNLTGKDVTDALRDYYKATGTNLAY